LGHLVGCGAGRWIRFFLERFAPEAIVGTDFAAPSVELLAQAVRDGAYAYLAKQRNVVIVVFLALLAVLMVLGLGLGLQPELTPLGVAVAGTLIEVAAQSVVQGEI